MKYTSRKYRLGTLLHWMNYYEKYIRIIIIKSKKRIIVSKY